LKEIVVLTYHLYYEGDNSPNALNDEKMQLIQDFLQDHNDILKLTKGTPIGMYLSHQYSENTLQLKNLKGNDALYYSLFSRSPRYKVSLVPVKIYVSEVEYEKNEVNVVIGERQSAFLLNDWLGPELQINDYKRNETGNEGTEISYHYYHGAILISENENYSSKKSKVD
jgi:hypothetical protein